jgi:hypothetical protein
MEGGGGSEEEEGVWTDGEGSTVIATSWLVRKTRMNASVRQAQCNKAFALEESAKWWSKLAEGIYPLPSPGQSNQQGVQRNGSASRNGAPTGMDGGKEVGRSVGVYVYVCV